MSNITGQFSLSETEMEIMEVIWAADRGFTFSELLTYFNSDKKAKDWKKQTLNTFLVRLIDKGALRSEKIGTKYVYFAVNTKKEHIQVWTHKLLDSVFDGSVKGFLTALTGGSKIDSKTRNELKAFLEDKK